MGILKLNGLVRRAVGPRTVKCAMRVAAGKRVVDKAVPCQTLTGGPDTVTPIRQPESPHGGNRLECAL